MPLSLSQKLQNIDCCGHICILSIILISLFSFLIYLLAFNNFLLLVLIRKPKKKQKADAVYRFSFFRGLYMDKSTFNTINMKSRENKIYLVHKSYFFVVQTNLSLRTKILINYNKKEIFESETGNRSFFFLLFFYILIKNSTRNIISRKPNRKK